MVPSSFCAFKALDAAELAEAACILREALAHLPSAYGGTNLFGQPLFPDVLAHAASVEAAPLGHALTFYRQHGFRVVGLLPDVNGPGRPDILMAKSLMSA